MNEEDLIKLENIEYIYPQLKEDWKKDLKNQYLFVLEAASEAMESLCTGNSFEDVYSIIANKGYESAGIGMCVGVVIFFARKNAPEFGEWVMKNKNPEFETEDTRAYLIELKERNARFDAELTEMETK